MSLDWLAGAVDSRRGSMQFAELKGKDNKPAFLFVVRFPCRTPLEIAQFESSLKALGYHPFILQKNARCFDVTLGRREEIKTFLETILPYLRLESRRRAAEIILAAIAYIEQRGLRTDSDIETIRKMREEFKETKK